MTKRLAFCLLLVLSVSAAGAAYRRLESGEVLHWRGAGLVIPGKGWVAQEGDGVLRLYRPAGIPLIGYLELLDPDEALADDLRVRGPDLADGLARFLAERLRRDYDGVGHLRRLDSPGSTPAVQLKFTSGDSFIRAVIYAPPTGGLYLLRLQCPLGEQRRVAGELERMIGEIVFTVPPAASPPRTAPPPDDHDPTPLDYD